MSISKKEIERIHSYKAQEYNDYVMTLNNHNDLEKILIYMIEKGVQERIRRTYSRYSIVRRRFEHKMAFNGKWYQ